jgi:hypothetical protein
LRPGDVPRQSLAGTIAFCLDGSREERSVIVREAMRLGAACVARLPLSLDRDAGARVVAWSPLLSRPGVARAAAFAKERGAREVSFERRAGELGPEMVAESLVVVAATLGTLPSDLALDSASSEGSAISLSVRTADGSSARLRFSIGTALHRLVVHAGTLALTLDGWDTRERLTLARGKEARGVDLPTVAPEEVHAAAANTASVPAIFSADEGMQALEMAEEALGLSALPAEGDWRTGTAPDDALGAAGLSLVEAAPGSREAVRGDAPTPSVEDTELLAFEAGRKPALYLTIPRDRAGALLPRLSGFAVERLFYTLERDPARDVRQRRKVEDEEQATHVDLFFACDADTARRCREIYQTPDGPSRHAAEMGALLGYPVCCVDAWARLASRRDNTAVRYATWVRTVAARAPFDWRLNNLRFHAVPFFPCTYGCRRAIAEAEWALSALFAEPDLLRRVERSLSMPIYYVDPARQLGFEATAASPTRVEYRTVIRGLSHVEPLTRTLADGFERSLGPLFAGGDEISVEPLRLVIRRAGAIHAVLERTGSRLGRLFPFRSGA